MFQHEIDFWAEFVKTDRFLKDWCSNNKTNELHTFVYNFITDRLPAKVLDCGSGAASILTGTVPNEDLTVCDVLAAEYVKLVDYAKLNVVPPQPIACEDLTDKEAYDIVHISNALDHTQAPVTAFNRLFEAVKPGGYLIIQSFENEGKHEKWQGLHQWNLALEGQRIALSAKHGKLWNSPVATITVKEYIPHMKKNWFIYVLKKDV